MGLDLWGKKGFLAWSIIMYHPEPPPLVRTTSAPAETEAIAAELSVPLANILTEWGNDNEGTKEQNQK